MLNFKDYKPKLFSDVDGVILDIQSSFYDWLYKKYPEYRKRLVKNVWGLGLNIDLANELMKKFQLDGEIKHLKYFLGAFAMINTLAEHFEIHIVTALDPEFDSDRRSNLEGLEYTTLTCAGKNKEQIVKDINPVIGIEDKPSLIHSFVEYGIDVYYPDTPELGIMTVGTPYRNWFQLIELIESHYA